MNELIKVEGRNIGDGLVQTINARELHAFLEVKSEFRNWIKNRIEDFGFIENQDFITAGKNLPSGKKQTDYHVALDMAKELAMVERNEKGKQARQYFIECEKRAKVPDVRAMLSSPDSLRLLLAGYVDKVIEQKAVIEQQEAIIEEQAPKADFYDAVADSINSQSIEEIAKELGTGRNRLFALLRKEKVLMEGNDNLPYQKYIDAGYFRVIMGKFKNKRGEIRTYTRTLVTGKGAVYIQKLVKDHPELNAGVRKQKVIEENFSK